MSFRTTIQCHPSLKKPERALWQSVGRLEVLWSMACRPWHFLLWVPIGFFFVRGRFFPASFRVFGNAFSHILLSAFRGFWFGRFGVFGLAFWCILQSDSKFRCPRFPKRRLGHFQNRSYALRKNAQKPFPKCPPDPKQNPQKAIRKNDLKLQKPLFPHAFGRFFIEKTRHQIHRNGATKNPVTAEPNMRMADL